MLFVKGHTKQQEYHDWVVLVASGKALQGVAEVCRSNPSIISNPSLSNPSADGVDALMAVFSGSSVAPFSPLDPSRKLLLTPCMIKAMWKLCKAQAAVRNTSPQTIQPLPKAHPHNFLVGQCLPCGSSSLSTKPLAKCFGQPHRRL